MPRLVRIALTLLAAATVMVFLVRQRALKLQEDINAGLTETAIAGETQMILLGTVLAGILIAVGIGLIITAVVRGRRKSPRADG